ncbi:hypothetical protein, partial [Natrinema sp. JCM 9743]
ISDVLIINLFPIPSYADATAHDTNHLPVENTLRVPFSNRILFCQFNQVVDVNSGFSNTETTADTVV